MNQVTTIAKVFFVALCLTSCATNEYLYVESGCKVEAQRQYPPKLQNYLVTKKRQVEVGDGIITCTKQSETTTRCQEGTKHVDQKYTVTETEDLNEDTRRNFVNQCAANRCVQLYGNHLCETSKSGTVGRNVEAPLSTDPQALNNLGLKYAKGQGVPQDYVEAAKWFRVAAVQGFADAQDNLGVIYQSGFGVPQDYAEAAKWFRFAAAQGQANARNNLGIMYENGHGVLPNKTVAYALYRSAASANTSYKKRATDYQAALVPKMSVDEIEAGQALGRELIKPGAFLNVLDKHVSGQ